MNTKADFDKFDDKKLRTILKRLDTYRELLLESKDIGVPNLTALVNKWIFQIKSNYSDREERAQRLEILKYAIETVSEFEQNNSLKIMGQMVLDQWDVKTKTFKVDF